MDAELRNLERKALQGDANAALAFVAMLQRGKVEIPATSHKMFATPGHEAGFVTMIDKNPAGIHNGDRAEVSNDAVSVRIFVKNNHKNQTVEFECLTTSSEVTVSVVGKRDTSPAVLNLPLSQAARDMVMGRRGERQLGTYDPGLDGQLTGFMEEEMEAMGLKPGDDLIETAECQEGRLNE